MFIASCSEIESFSTNTVAFTRAPPVWTGTSVGAPPRVLLERPYSTANGVSRGWRLAVASTSSCPGSLISEPKPKIPYRGFPGDAESVAGSPLPDVAAACWAAASIARADASNPQRTTDIGRHIETLTEDRPTGVDEPG